MISITLDINGLIIQQFLINCMIMIPSATYLAQSDHYGKKLIMSPPKVTSGRQGAPLAEESKSGHQPRQYMPAEERRNQILESARAVFAQSGLKGARTRELAQAAGINPATLFDHFKSKEELFIAAIMQPLSVQLESARERIQAYESADSWESLNALLSNGIQNNLEDMVDSFPLLAQALFSDRELGDRFYHEQIHPLLKTRADMMVDLTREGFDPDLLQLIFFGMFFAIAMDQQITGNKRDLAQVARQVTELVTGGCARPQFTE